MSDASKETRPHCSGHLERMANPVCKVLLTKAPLKAPENDVDPAAGAVVVFWGVVRELEDGRKIEGIDYEAHQAMAEHQLQLVAEAATEKPFDSMFRARFSPITARPITPISH